MSKTVELAQTPRRSSTSITCIRPISTGRGTRRDEELDAVFTVADALRDLRERNKTTRRSSIPASASPSSATTPPVPASPSPPPATCWAWRCRTSTRRSPRSPTARPSARLRTWCPSWPTSSASAMICTSGEGHKYQKTFMDAREGRLSATVFSSSSPTLVNLQCDVDHPTQCMADMLHVIHYFGGVENLKGKKVAMTWAYSPSYGKPLSLCRRASSACSPASAWTSCSPIPRAMRSCPRSRMIARANC